MKVVMKLIAPNNDENPDKCKLKIAKSTAGPLCDWIPANGKYTVHPVPAPASTKAEVNININEGTNSQNEILFNLAKAISLAPNIKGIR
jgi:hypothetical protein